MFTAESFAEFLETFNALLGVDHTDVRVDFSNQWGGSTDVDSCEIFITVKGSQLSRKERAIAEAIDLHEIAHIMFTPSDLYQELKKHFPVDNSITNAFEDLRIETLFARRYNSLRYILPLNLINVMDGIPEDTDYAQLRLIALLLYGRYLYGDQKAREKLKPILEHLGRVVDISDIPTFVNSYITYVNEDDFHEAARVIWEFQKTLNPSEQNRKSSPKSEEDKDTQSGPDDLTDGRENEGDDPEENDPGEEAPDDTDEPSPDVKSTLSQVKEEIQTAVESLASSVQSEDVIRDSFVELSRPPHIFYKKEVSPKWKKLLRSLELTSEGPRISYGRRGRKISQKHLHKILNQQYVFERKRITLSDQGRVLFMVDMSGSMDSIADDVQEMVWAITEVLEKRHRYRVAWIYFSLRDRSFVVKKSEDTLPLPTDFRASSSATVLSDALAMKKFLAKADIEIVISDGFLNDIRKLSQDLSAKESILLYIPIHGNDVSTAKLRKLFRSVVVINRTPESVVKGFKQIERFFR